MDLETQQFVNGCLGRAVEKMKRLRTPEEIAESERRFAQIRYNGAAALERLESGQRTAYQRIKHIRYRG